MRLTPGDRFEVRTRSELNTSTDLAGASQAQTQRSTQVLLFDVKTVGPDGSATIDATIQSMDVPELDALGPVGEAVSSAGGLSLEGSAFTLTMSPKGRVTSVTGMDRVAAETGEKLSGVVKEQMSRMSDQLPEAMKGMGQTVLGELDVFLRKAVRRQMGDEAMREQLEAAFWVYPDGPVGKGATWERTVTQTQAQPMVAQETYTVEGADDGVTRLTVASQVSPNTTAEPMSIMGQQFRLDLNGTQKGTVEIDTASGWIKSRSTSVDLSGSASVMGMQINTKITGTVWLEVTRK